MRQAGLRRRFWVESALAVVTGVVALMTILQRDWLEIFGIEPDAGDGSVELLITLALAVVTVLFAAAASVDWRRRGTSTAGN
jgi:hypothetical protein